ncbi:MAG TPA: M15 family metallopeptidase [Kribbella sp.]|jgi:D-alanyl-D-alanine carboxypeptidase
MTNEPPPRRTISVQVRLLSVTGLAAAVVMSLLIWHAQLADVLNLNSAADKQPVVAGSGGPGAAPPAVELSARTTPRPAKTPTVTPTGTPSQPLKPKSTPSAGESYDDRSDAGLTPRLRTRLRKATVAAKADGITISITSGRRSVAKQQTLLREAIARYGSYKAATRWVLPPQYSAHVKGMAVDIGPQAAMAWLNQNGWRYGICRRYDNEPWHFEALTTPGKRCPARESHAVAKAD